MLAWIELALTLLALLLALTYPQLAHGPLSRIEESFRRLARKPHLAVALVGLAGIAIRLAVLPLLPIPEPRVTDEYSQLLLADTFLHARATNPTPALWPHFETFQVVMRPTYASMYPPAQGLVLAAGRLLTHQAFWGVLLSVGAMCAAICWMLQGWVSLDWALLGGFLAVTRLAAFSYWADTYWGAPVAATGGAFVLGALPRILGWTPPQNSLAASPSSTARPTLLALIMALGLVILANIRPYEGLILSIPAGIALLIWLLQQAKSGSRSAITKVLLPMLIILVLAGALMCFYFWRVTGSRFEMPQALNRATYAQAPYFIWQHPNQVAPYRHAIFRDLYVDFEMVVYQQTRSFRGLFGLWIIRAASLWAFFLAPILTLPIFLALGVPPAKQAARSSSSRFLALTSAFCFLGLFVEVFLAPHYAAPMAALTLLLILLAVRRVHHWRRRNAPTGIFITRAVVAICCLMLLIRVFAGPLHIPIEGGLWSWGNAASAAPSQRKLTEGKIAAQPGNHLVIVHPDPVHRQKSDLNWVYNAADLDTSRIIWGWDMGAKENQELIDAYKSRTVWLLQPDRNDSQQLTIYPGTAASNGAR